MEKLSMSVNELAETMGLSIPMAYRIANMQGFPAVRIGRRICINIEGLKKWLEEHEGQQIEGMRPL